MNVSHFIAKRLAFSKSQSFVRVIIRIATIAVAISLAVMILTSLIINGFKKEISSKVFGFWGHIHITDTNVNRTFEQIPISKNGDLLDKIKGIKYIEYQSPVTYFGREVRGKYKTQRTKGGVRLVQPFAMAPGVMSTKKDFGAIILKGIDKTFEWDYFPEFIVDGDTLTLTGDLENGIIVSSITAREMQLKVGQKIRVSFIRNGDQIKRVFRVKGIYNTGLEEYDKRFALVDLRKVQGILGWKDDEITGYEVFVDDIDDLDIINDYIYNEILPARYYSESIRSKFPSIFEWLKLQDINEDLLMWLMIIVGAINMITALLILILERSHMIGVLKSLGATNRQIQKVFLYHAMYIILAGMLIGNLLGLGIGALQYYTRFIKLDETSYYLSYAPVLFDPGAILLINLLCITLILSFLIVPTFLVTKILPVKTLRFE